MKKFLIILTIVLALGIGAFAYLNVTRQAETVDQTNRPATENITAQNEGGKQGAFVDGDSLHKGKGTARIVTLESGQKALKFESDFSVTNGPDLFVYLSKNPNAANDKELGEFVSLGRLQSTNGEQVYNLPKDADEYSSVIVYCRAFSVVFAVAELQ